jgi:predicted nucleic acid-binding protein
VVASDLTFIECDRILIRRQATGSLTDAGVDRLRRRLTATAAHWSVLRIEREIVERARRPFPGEPIRTLDAIHLASALVARAALEDFALLSLDERVRSSGRALGLQVLPP